jgi:hypothetical protein
MPRKLNIKGNEKSTVVFTITFKDENKAAVIPSSITWSLLTPKGTIVNNRKDVSVATPAASIDIVLSGNDLATGSTKVNATVNRHLTVKAVYDSDAGTGLTSTEEFVFLVYNLSGVA